MKITRIRIPEFRALKNIDITFEPDFTPNIFPLASLNGGGKSTLLQLVFILLKSLDPKSKDIKPLIHNFLRNFKINECKKTIAHIDIQDDSNQYTIEYQLYIEKVDKLDQYPEYFWKDRDRMASETMILSIVQEKNNINEELNKFESNLVNLEAKLEFSEVENDEDKAMHIELDAKVNELRGYRHFLLFQEKEARSGLFAKSNTIPLTFFDEYKGGNFSKFFLLTCQILGFSNDIDSIEKELQTISKKIFLAIPSTQPILFFDIHQRQMLFQDRFDEYQAAVKESQELLSSFFTYSFLPVNLIQSFFDRVFTLDIQQAIETKGEYGNHYRKLLDEMSCVLENKIVNISPDRKTITFEMEDENGELRKLYPEDLSHGELKRLSIYLWLKYYDIKDAVVLMDEIEIAFHPDWQYQIIRDLQEWGASNQYILATHSYELCQALTPAHVKEISPNLLPSQENESQF